MKTVKKMPRKDAFSILIGVSLLASLLTTVPARAAHAARAETKDTLVVRPTVDVPLTLGSGVLFLTLFLTPHRQGTLLDQTVGEKKGLDVFAASTLNHGLADFTDYLLFASVAVGLGLVGVDGARHGRFGTRTLLYVESVMMVAMVTELTKWAVRRARPYTFTERLGVPDDGVSFFSGHTSTMAAWAFSAVRILDLTHDWPGWLRAVGYGSATFVTAAMATMRVMAGKHWPTDVMVGAVVGGAVGWLVPELHRQEMPVQLAVAPIKGGARLVVGGTF